MIISIHQPNFLPWIGYLNKLVSSNIFVLFDDVQFPRGHSFGNRVLIKSSSGAQWITIPVKGKSELLQFNQVSIDYSGRWLDKLLKSLKLNYQKSSYFEEIYESLSKILLSRHSELLDLNFALLTFVKEYLDIKTNLVFSSEIESAKNLSGSEKIITLLKALNASTYLSGEGSGSKRYITEDDFVQENIKLVYQHFQHPVYPQLYGEFIPKLSIIDLLFNCGPDSKTYILCQ